MKYSVKCITFLSLLGLMSLTGCSEDEELNLTSYPDNSSSIIITDVEEKTSQVILKAHYDENGQLQLNSEIPQMYSFRLYTPSLEEAHVRFEAFTNNMPTELMSIDKTTASIPVGYTDAQLTATFDKDKWLELAAPERSAQIYEMGIKASVQGYKMDNAASMAKVVIRKEAYEATCYVSNDETDLSFVYNYSQLTPETKVTIPNITVALDRPADKDITINIRTEGLLPQFLDDIVINDGSPVIIPQGSKSVTFDWELGANFMLENGEIAEKFNLNLQFEIKTEDSTVKLDDTRDLMTVYIEKMVKNLEQPEKPIPESWHQLNKKGWEISEIDSDILSSRFPGNLIKYGENSLVDGNDSNKAIEIFVAAKRFVPRSNFLFTVDMQNTQTFSGIRVKYLGSNPSNFYKEVTISLSSNNSTWTKVGTIENAVEKNGTSDFIFLVPVKAQYIKIEMDIPIKEADYINITEVTVYQK